MKKLLFIIAFSIFSVCVFAQTTVVTEETDEENVEIYEKTGFPKIKKRPFVVFNEGIEYANITRIQKQEKSNNFVWNNNLIGAFFEVQSKNMKPINSLIKVSAFYPFAYTFNDVPQVAKQTILYAFDLFAGPMLEADMWKYVRLKASLGLHYMYQLTDEYHLNYLGGGLLLGLELPVAPRWTILLDGTFDIDYPNFGTNEKVQPYDYSWQYHANLGVRYSKKAENRYSYIRKTAMQTAKWEMVEKQKAERKEEKAKLRAQKKEEKQRLYEEENAEKIAIKQAQKEEKQRLKEEKKAAKQEAYNEKLENARQKLQEKQEAKEAKRAEKQAAKEAAKKSRFEQNYQSEQEQQAEE